MKRSRFMPPRLTSQPAAPAAAAPPPPLAIFDCLFSRQGKRGAPAIDGTLVLMDGKALLFNLALEERAAGRLPAAAAAALHAAHAAAVAALAAGEPLGPLFVDGTEAPDALAVDGFSIELDDSRDAAVRPEEWALRQRTAEEARGGKPKDAMGAAIPADSLGARMMAVMGWRPGQGLGRQAGGGSGLVLPALKWDRAGLGASANVKRLGVQKTTFRRAAAVAGGAAAARAKGGAGAEP